MQKLRFLLFAITTIVIMTMVFSCKQSSSETEQSASAALVEEAKLAATKLVATVNSNMGKTEYKIFDTDVVYSTDSLCILHIKVGDNENTASNNEYCYLSYKQNKYELLTFPNAVYVSEDEYKKSNDSKPYNEYIFTKAVDEINRSGFLAGQPFKPLNEKIQLAYEMGNWDIADYVDDFGDKDGSHFLALFGSGVFSNTATTNSPLNVVLSFDAQRNMFWFKLFEYNKNLIRDKKIYNLKIKDSKGNYGEVNLYCNERGCLELTLENDSAAFAVMLKGMLREGEMSFAAHRESGLANEYKFKLNVTGFSNAMKSLYGFDPKESMSKLLEE